MKSSSSIQKKKNQILRQGLIQIYREKYWIPNVQTQYHMFTTTCNIPSALLDCQYFSIHHDHLIKLKLVRK